MLLLLFPYLFLVDLVRLIEVYDVLQLLLVVHLQLLLVLLAQVLVVFQVEIVVLKLSLSLACMDVDLFQKLCVFLLKKL